MRRGSRQIHPATVMKSGECMYGKRVSGLIGIVVGGAWLAWNMQYFKQQGFVAIGMPLLILVLGLFYFFGTGKSSE
jgi:hypothetical protein